MTSTGWTEELEWDEAEGSRLDERYADKQVGGTKDKATKQSRMTAKENLS